MRKCDSRWMDDWESLEFVKTETYGFYKPKDDAPDWVKESFERYCDQTGIKEVVEAYS
jgi:hypothetical protein